MPKKNEKVFVGVKIVYTFAVLLKRRTALLRGVNKVNKRGVSAKLALRINADKS